MADQWAPPTGPGAPPAAAGPTRWEYWIEQLSMADRWSEKRQTAEIAALLARMNALGADGWELVGYETIPMYGAWQKTLKGHAYLMFWKRRVAQ